MTFKQKSGMWKSWLALLWIFLVLGRKKNDNNYNKESKAMEKHIKYILSIYVMAFFAHLAQKAESCSMKEDKQAIWFEESWDRA